ALLIRQDIGGNGWNAAFSWRTGMSTRHWMTAQDFPCATFPAAGSKKKPQPDAQAEAVSDKRKMKSTYRPAKAGSCADLKASKRWLISSQFTTFHQACRYSGRRLLYLR